MDIVLAPDDKLLSAIVSLAIGIVLTLLLGCRCFELPRSDDTPLCGSYAAAERCYTVVAGFATVNFWRGVWYLWDVSDMGLGSAVLSHFLGLAVLFAVWSGRSILAPPSVFMADNDSLGYLNGTYELALRAARGGTRTASPVVEDETPEGPPKDVSI